MAANWVRILLGDPAVAGTRTAAPVAANDSYAQPAPQDSMAAGAASGVLAGQTGVFEMWGPGGPDVQAALLPNVDPTALSLGLGAQGAPWLGLGAQGAAAQTPWPAEEPFVYATDSAATVATGGPLPLMGDWSAAFADWATLLAPPERAAFDSSFAQTATSHIGAAPLLAPAAPDVWVDGTKP